MDAITIATSGVLSSVLVVTDSAMAVAAVASSLRTRRARLGRPGPAIDGTSSVAAA